MARLEWQHPPLAVNPFEAAAGDYTRYRVHVCKARNHSGEEAEVLTTVLRAALTAALSVSRAEARYFLCEIDVVYSILTLLVTDRERKADGLEIYKLQFLDWDEELQSKLKDLPEKDQDSAFRVWLERMQKLLEECINRSELKPVVDQLKAKGFVFCIVECESEAEWYPIKV